MRSSEGNVKNILETCSNVSLTLGPISIPIQSILNFFKKAATDNKKPLKNWSLDLAIQALAPAVEWLLADRVAEGIGIGGWGQSDAKYMLYLYGEGEAITDSVMTTVVTMEAITRFINIIELLELGEWNSSKQREWWNCSIQQDVFEYAKKRWNPRTGEGGTLKLGREGDWALAPRYRHTSWLVRLWLILPGTYKNIRTTIRALVEGCDIVPWDTEKVATPVAAYTALRELAKRHTVEGILPKVESELLSDIFLDLVKAKYKPDIKGWTSGLDPRKGRHLYTLFVLAELSKDWENLDEELRNMID